MMEPYSKSRSSDKCHWLDSLLGERSPSAPLLFRICLANGNQAHLPKPPIHLLLSEKLQGLFTAMGSSCWHHSLHLSALVGLEVEGGQVSPLPTTISYSPPILAHSRSDSSFRSHLCSALTSLTSLSIQTTQFLLASKPPWPIELGAYDSHLYRCLLFNGFLLSVQV